MRGPKLKIVADRDLPFVREYFDDEGELVLRPGRQLKREDLLDADLLLVRSITQVDENLLQGSSVKFVGTVTTGIDHLDTAWLDQAGILWRSAAGYNALPVADYVIAVIAALQQERALPEALRVGVVGVGHVGGCVAERCQRLGFEVLLSDPPRAEQETNFPSQRLSDLKNLDLVSLHVPLQRSGKHATYHMINRDFLRATTQPAVLLNTSRGPLVDFNGLEKERTLWRYCFDVWENEPLIDSGILQASHIATPHLAGYSLQCRYRGIAQIYQACCELDLLRPKTKVLPLLPSQRLSFENRKLSWQEVVLAIFNPLAVTQVMKEAFLKKKTTFDALRERYIGEQIQRHEFSSTIVSELYLDEKDRYALMQLGITIEE